MDVLECLSRLEKSMRVKDRFLFKSCSFVDACIKEDDFFVRNVSSEFWKRFLLTTFNKPFGRYRFTQMPFVIHLAQDVFQKAMDLAFEGINGCKSIIDDMLVWGSSKEEHDQNLSKVLERTRKVGIKWNAEKCVFGTKEVSFFGHELSDQGVQPDPKKIAAIQEMEPPRNKQELVVHHQRGQL